MTLINHLPKNIKAGFCYDLVSKQKSSIVKNKTIAYRVLDEAIFHKYISKKIFRKYIPKSMLELALLIASFPENIVDQARKDVTPLKKYFNEDDFEHTMGVLERGKYLPQYGRLRFKETSVEEIRKKQKRNSLENVAATTNGCYYSSSIGRFKP